MKRPSYINSRAWFAIRRSRRKAWMRWMNGDGPEPVEYRRQPGACHGWFRQYHPPGDLAGVGHVVAG